MTFSDWLLKTRLQRKQLLEGLIIASIALVMRWVFDPWLVLYRSQSVYNGFAIACVCGMVCFVIIRTVIYRTGNPRVLMVMGVLVRIVGILTIASACGLVLMMNP